MHGFLVVSMLAGCSWLMENPDEVPRAAPRVHKSVVERSNQVQRGEGIDPTARGALTGDVIGSAEGESEGGGGRKYYNPVSTPITMEAAAAELKNSQGVIIRNGPKAEKKSDYQKILSEVTDPEVRKAILLEMETARKAGFDPNR
ncbi:MAG: hypothetical protein H6736_16530 [Alphaproteobacteria bacterium]|nr:hypothetical protein [Alphaproteobacteria bacterium]MCB9693421.1 hypothetical protein [Alphaproteobacteria bacterium]